MKNRNHWLKQFQSVVFLFTDSLREYYLVSLEHLSY